ncbi:MULTISPECIES: hypothetical protein [Pseudomonas]|uniref:Uncharacterized protein n=1 Tax=Pseudomonas luteola TaxID=47886 RepID=A0ABS0FPR0_PSELU|nr:MULTISPECIES: hypothetical protein [Pseudomonas]MBF8642299.1 hypothetical protein [Pseudomonas zeshuii]SHJ23694.1 hypothetical protein SAMN05216295_109194 [Pseudomonas zeshuii]
MIGFLQSSRKETKSAFADFIRNARSDEKKKVYNTVLAQATKRQNDVLEAVRCRG